VELEKFLKFFSFDDWITLAVDLTFQLWDSDMMPQ